MERLTQRNPNGYGYDVVCSEWGVPSFEMFISSLGAYEDTGLTPAEVKSLWAEWNAMLSVLDGIGGYDRIRELAKADKEGRVVVLDFNESDGIK